MGLIGSTLLSPFRTYCGVPESRAAWLITMQVLMQAGYMRPVSADGWYSQRFQKLFRGVRQLSKDSKDQDLREVEFNLRKAPRC